MISLGVLLWMFVIPVIGWAMTPEPSQCATCPCIRAEGVLLTRADYEQTALLRLNSYTTWEARSQAIHQRYAELYLQNPNKFKWAGMAAFAGREIQKRLQQIETTYDALANFRYGITRNQCQL